jgi:hypothetical protein
MLVGRGSKAGTVCCVRSVIGFQHKDAGASTMYALIGLQGQGQGRWGGVLREDRWAGR